MRLTLTAFGTLLLLISLSGCGASDSFPGLYRVEVQQGNIVTQKMVDQLRPGMDRKQVRYLMGPPLLTDTFTPDRWDYYYSLRDHDGAIMQKRVALYFTDEALTQIDGDIAPGVKPARGVRPSVVTKDRIEIDINAKASDKPAPK